MHKEIAAGMDAINARFDRLMAGIAQQFELMEVRSRERHERLLEYMHSRFERIDARFDQVDRRFDEERAKTAGHFEAQQKRIDRRFDLLAEGLESRFATLQRRGAREP